MYPDLLHKSPVRTNRLRELLRSGSPSLGTHLLSTWPTVTELVGQTGQWDYVEFVAEYAPWTMHDLDNLGRAIELFPDFTGMIKVEQHTRGHVPGGGRRGPGCAAAAHRATREAIRC